MALTRPALARRHGRRAALVAVGLGVLALHGVLRAEQERSSPAVRPLAFAKGRLVVPLGLPAPWVPPSNPMSEAKVELGGRLFLDRRLSRDGTKGCVDCHDPDKGFADGRPTALGVRGQVGHRNVPTLLNAAVYPALLWDGRAVSLEAQAEGPLLAPTELDMTEDLLVERVASDPAYAPAFRAAFGSETVSLRRVAQALAAFQRTLLAADSPFDRFWFGGDEAALSVEARRGHELFRTKGACASCHVVGPSDAAFTDFGFHATGTVAEGATDLGRFNVTGLDDDRGRFRTPSLRNVALTAPYFHDGSAATLLDVVEHYDRGGRRVAGRAPEISPLRLSADEKADLVAFLESLTSPAAPTRRETLRETPPAGPAASPSPLDAPDAETTDPGALRLAAEAALETDPSDAKAWRALLEAVGRLADADLLADAMERAEGSGVAGLSRALGRAHLRRARFATPADAADLAEAEGRLAGADGPEGPAREALDLAWVRHLRGDVAGALLAYERAMLDDEATGDRAWRGVESLLHGDDVRLRTVAETLAARHPTCGPAVRAHAASLERTSAGAGAAALRRAGTLLATSPRTQTMLAGLLRRGADEAAAHLEALALERRALELAGADAEVLDAIQGLWRAERPLASVADVEAWLGDAHALLRALRRGRPSDADRALTYRNDLAFRLRDVVAAFAWRGEGRTQGLASGAPAAARRWLDQVVAWYEEAVALVPEDAASQPFHRRWLFAGVLNDAGLMRHYWVDVQDLPRAQAHYLRAFDLTDGAYVDTYHYNLQYLFGLERPGQEDLWLALARRAARAVLKEDGAGGFVPDEGKREAARRDAEALERRRAAAAPR